MTHFTQYGECPVMIVIMMSAQLLLYFTFVKLFVTSIRNIDVKSTTVDARCRRCFEMSLTVSPTTSFRNVVNCVVTDASNRHYFIIPLFVSYSGSVTCHSRLPLLIGAL
jgi:hypothetical protein